MCQTEAMAGQRARQWSQGCSKHSWYGTSLARVGEYGAKLHLRADAATLRLMLAGLAVSGLLGVHVSRDEYTGGDRRRSVLMA